MTVKSDMTCQREIPNPDFFLIVFILTLTVTGNNLLAVHEETTRVNNERQCDEIFLFFDRNRTYEIHEIFVSEREKIVVCSPNVFIFISLSFKLTT